ncbi:bsr1514 [Bradyrhizobium diazoefficiens USDA 110]|uniref:Bsr1514 protein n=1 Tax=Bradyrhizobium diazoefficiens (strain JCM 10833 / BCRC 13528 / IAM 13628 / NBRC 14792 / USDA 110) TaxID=224911 RepID=Q89UA3_BRADU|nr:hypothetical protein CO678_22850 [Bradyrhizobium diazoefficiens]QBP20446.1 hypothetical protein Bdiaspc4_07625 [Bradyrhizobium diazoefficiens]BAC46779.1 bsr1514 [Bradyrhizobium diazoefficiens USDA 110]
MAHATTRHPRAGPLRVTSGDAMIDRKTSAWPSVAECRLRPRERTSRLETFDCDVLSQRAAMELDSQSGESRKVT